MRLSVVLAGAGLWLACQGGGSIDTGIDTGSNDAVETAPEVAVETDVPEETGWPEGVEPLDPEPDPVTAGGLPAETWIDATTRERLDLSGDWSFAFDDGDQGVAAGWWDPGFDRGAWLPTRVPGTWDLHVEGGFGRQTVGWYSRVFTPGDLGPRQRLRFDGAFLATRVWLNGKELGGDDLPYLPFAFDVTGVLRPGEQNLLVVRVDSRMDRATLPADTTGHPGKHGWFPYGGITRPVTVEGSLDASVARCAIRSGPDGAFHADVRLRRSEPATAVTVSAKALCGPALLRTWDPVALDPGVEGVALSATLDVLPWHPGDATTTCRLEVAVEDGQGRRETVSYGFAPRAFEARDGRFLLDGIDRYLHGVNRHEDHEDLGPVYDADAMAADLALMKDLHVDFVRPAHYPNDARVLRDLEAAGILIAEEVPVYQVDGTQMADPVFRDRCLRAVRRMVTRDVNRPGIVMWSVANEIWTYAPEAEDFVQALVDAAKALDPTRPVMLASEMMPVFSFTEVDRGLLPVDVVGVNEYWGWYWSETGGLAAYLDQAHAFVPGKTLFLSEFGADALRGRRLRVAPSEEPLDDHSYSEDWQSWFLRQHLRQAASRDFVRGAMPWVLSDFRMEWTQTTAKPHPRDRMNLKGLTDIHRQPKAAFGMVKAAFSDPAGLVAPAEPACGDGEVGIGETCDGGERACAELGASWGGGSAPCRDDCQGWDVSGCALVLPAGKWEVVKPAERDPGRWADARCNDGSPFAFRVRPSPVRSTQWVIDLRGGGVCDDNAVPCFRPPDLQSSTPDPDRAAIVPVEDVGGIQDDRPDRNPRLFEANHVFAWYCSSDFWAGTETWRLPTMGDPEKGWYFSGRVNARVLVESLQALYGLSDDDGVRVVWAGTSSGAIGAAATVDLAADRLPGLAASGRLMLLPDAGWLVASWDEPDMRIGMATEPDAEVMRLAARRFHYGFGARCERERSYAGGFPADCLFGVHWFPAIAGPRPDGLGLPVLVTQSLMDDTFVEYHQKADDPIAAARYGEAQLADVLSVDPGASTPLIASWFLGWASYHDVLTDGDEWTWFGDPGNTIREAIGRFVDGGPRERVIWGEPPG